MTRVSERLHAPCTARVELDAERLDDVRRQDDEEQQVGQTGAALVGDELFLCQKNADGQLIKKEYGPWVFTAFKLMAKLRFLRGGVFDIFGYSEERKSERQLIGDYEKTIGELLASLNATNLPLAAEIASIPEHIRGYGHVKEAHLHKAKAREAELLGEWVNPLRVVQAA